MDQKMHPHLHQRDVTDNFQGRLYLQDVECLDALQNRGEQNQDVVLTFRDVHLENLVHLQDVVVDAEPHHQLRMDCFQDVVDVELQVLFHQKSRTDYFQDVEQLVYFLQLALRHLKQVLAQELLPQRFQRAMPLAPLNQRQVRRQVRRQVQG
jgi:hypothetical protein